MSDGQTIILRGNRDTAHRIVAVAPAGFVLNVRPPRRSGDQNDKMWAMLGDVSRAKPEGRTMTPDVWKALFMHSLDHTQRFEQALDGNGMVPVGFRSSRMTKALMSDLIETIYEYGERHGVAWNDPTIAIETRSGETRTRLDPKDESAGLKGIAQKEQSA